MTYFSKDKFSNFSKTSGNITPQQISTTYTVLSGSTHEIKFEKDTANVFYKFCFYTYNNYVSSTNYDKTFIHVKLQKSNDNFSSNIVDIPGCQFNFSADTIENQNWFYMSCSSFFIVEDLDSKYLRLMVRSYSTNNETRLHVTDYFNGGTQTEYYSPMYIVAEI